jgi:dTDP-4-amino-4,6-dideoxygalactose transaminase
VFIEDSSQSIGSSLNGIKAGTIGDCSVYSFNSNKVIAGINGGGVFLTNNESQVKFFKKIRRHGKDSDFEMLGYNSRMYVLNAEIINLRLKNMERTQLRRQEIARHYNTIFKELPMHVQSSTQELNHNFHKYTIRVTDNKTRNHLQKLLGASIHYEIPLSSNSMYDKIFHRKDNCINSKIVADTILSLPIHAWLTSNEINTIINIIGENYDI